MAEDIFKNVDFPASLAGVEVHPKCDDHATEIDLDVDENGVCVRLHCANCGFTMWMSPSCLLSFKEDDGIEIPAEIESQLRDLGVEGWTA